MGTTVAALLVVGAILLFLETILPGLIAGIVGLCCLIAGVVVGFMNFDAGTASLILLGVIVGLLAGIFAWLKYFPGSRFARPFISQGVSGGEAVEETELLNQTGTTVTPLRPAGTALIGGRRMDVVSDGGFVEEGRAVKVADVQGLRIVVRAV